MPFLTGQTIIFLGLVVSLVSLGRLEAQEVESEASPRPPIARTYRSIMLGMSLEEVKDLLAQDSWFDYQGDAVLSLLERPRASLLDVGGSLFLSRAYFQFEENTLIAIVLELNLEAIDWYTMYRRLEQRYGVSITMDPTKVWWEDGETRLALERPLTIKYLDLGFYDQLSTDREEGAAWREKLREEFLDAF